MKKLFSFALRHPQPCFLLLGALSALPMVWPGLFFLAFLGLGGAFALLCHHRRAKAGRRWRMGFCFFFAYHLVVYSFFLWMYPLESTQLPPVAALGIVLAAWLGISALQAVVAAFVFLLLSPLTRCRLNAWTPAVFAALWGIMEWIMELGTLGFPWIRLAYGQYLFGPLVQAASLVGSVGVGVLVVLIAAYAALGLFAGRGAYLRVGLGLLAAVVAYGVVAPLLTAGRAEQSLTVTTVQGNVLSDEKWQAGRLQTIVDTYFDLSRQGEPADLILWPETAIPVNLAYSPYYLQAYSQLSQELGAPLVLGTFYADGAGRTQNAVAAVTPQGLAGTYAKRHLVPFGEYLPWRSVLSALVPQLAQINQLASDLSAGRGPQPISLEGVTLGPLVCFDSAFAPLARESAGAGAGLLVLATNDSWYKDSPACGQHLAQCVLRSIENRRSVAVSANTGISAFIDPYGRVLSTLPALTQGTLTGQVALRQDTTLYTLWGDLPLLLACAGICLAARLTGRKESQ